MDPMNLTPLQGPASRETDKDTKNEEAELRPGRIKGKEQARRAHRMQVPGSGIRV